MLSLMILPIILACNGSVIAQNGYDYGHPYEWADPQANINNPKSVSPKNWTPAPERRSFQALLRDVVTERQAFFGLPLGVLAGVGGVSCLLTNFSIEHIDNGTIHNCATQRDLGFESILS